MHTLAELPNLTELTYRSIKKSVLDGTFGLESRLTEESLSTQLGISKSPVREALNRLAAEGLISIEARRGAYVRQFSMKEVADLYELRELLEVQAISLAVITPELLRDLSASITRTRAQLKTHSKSGHIQEDLVFHSLIPSATGNEELCRVIENIQHKSLLCHARSYELSADRTPTAHQKIYQSLRSGTRAEARAAMREHIAFVRDRLLASMQS
jgi:DNA-binding GntR family transcriptional regulator